MPRIQSFDTMGISPDFFLLSVRVEVADAEEGRELLNRIAALIEPTARRATADGALLAAVEEEREERKAIQEVELEEQRRAEAVDRDELEEQRRAEDEKRLRQEAAQPPRRVEGKPGLNPAAALAAYDEEHEDTSGSTGEFSGYTIGGRYDGVEIVKVQTSAKKGFGVLTLTDGSKIKYDLETGRTLATKNRPSAPEGEVLTVAPTARQTGLGAPDEDEPVADSNGTPQGEVSGWMRPIVEAPTLKEAVAAALTRIEPGDMPTWAVAKREEVPAFQRVAKGKLKARVERQVAALGGAGA